MYGTAHGPINAQDFTHDNEMIEIITALGLRPHADGLWVTAELIPFGARWAFERVRCSEGIRGGTDATFVRILIK